jgi:hypothetical protein
MLSRLTPESKRALLEQAMRVLTFNEYGEYGEHTDVFVKFLVSNVLISTLIKSLRWSITRLLT